MAASLQQRRIGIVYGSWYPEIVGDLLKSAVETLVASGVSRELIMLYQAPGSFEIPLIGRNLAEKGSVDALIALGVIVRGETHHADLIATEAARGCMDVQLRYGIPFAFEILYVDHIGLAEARRDRGAEAAKALLQALKSIYGIV